MENLFEGKTVLVTGGTGLIGRALVDRLRARGANVCCWSRSDRLLPEPDPDYFIHAAGYGQPARFMADPLGTIAAATTMLARGARQLKPGGSLLFLSSSEVYSGCASIPHLETDIGTTAPDHPRGCYIEAKRCGEAIVHALRHSGMDAKIARVSLVYGPSTWDDQRVLPSFIRQALTDGVIRLRDNGRAIRAYCYISDAIDMLLNVLTRGKQAVYNVGGESATNIFALAWEIASQCDAHVISPDDPAPLAGAPDRVAVDISRYKAEFGRPDFVPLYLGLATTIAEMRAQLRSAA